MTAFFQTDNRYRRWLAERPGLWLEVGAYDDLMFLSALRDERQALGLSPSPAGCRRLATVGQRRSHSTVLQPALGFAQHPPEERR